MPKIVLRNNEEGTVFTMDTDTFTIQSLAVNPQENIGVVSYIVKGEEAETSLGCYRFTLDELDTDAINYFEAKGFPLA